MIFIVLDSDKKECIENLYWEWLERNQLKKLKEIIKGDDFFKEVIKICEPDVSSGEISDELLKKFVCSEKDVIEKMKDFIQEEYNKKENEFNGKVRQTIDERKKKRCPKNKKEIKKEILKQKRFKLLKDQEKTYNTISSIYDKFRQELAGKIVQQLGIRVCPYCNQNYINSIYILKKEKGEERRLNFQGEIDHFYPKSKYPYLAICLYNMIPSCKVCNHSKRTSEKSINYPYIFGEENKSTSIQFKTTFQQNHGIGYIWGKTLNFDIEITGVTSEDENEIKEVFQLEARYKVLKEEARDIIKKSQAYSGRYLQALEAAWENMGITEEEMKEIIFGYSKDHLTKPLSKFNFDIMNEFEEFMNKK